jgi:cell division protein FtsW (lipid II flippase)
LATITFGNELLKRARGPLVVALFTTLAFFCVAWIGRGESAEFIRGLGKPHISGEIFKVAMFLAGAWLMYRVGEWGSSGTRALRSSLLLLLVGAACAIGLAFSQDFGPGMVIMLTGLWLCSIAMVRQCGGSFRLPQRITLWTLVAIAVCTSWFVYVRAITDVAPRFSSRAHERIVAIENPFSGPTVYLAQIRWLLDATPPGGFGLGNVPWCGAKAALDIGNCSKHSGMPVQTPSDYAFAGLVATWGFAGAAGLVIAVLIWLSLLANAVLRPSEKTSLAPPWTLLEVWLVVIPSISNQAQTVITVSGSLGWPLTGITLPVLGYGTAALLALAPWVGFALNPIGPAYQGDAV